ENVAAALRPVDVVAQTLRPGAIGTLSGNPYEASRFLLPESWAALAKRWNGQLIVAIPGTDVVLYGRPQDGASIADMAMLARIAAAKANRPLSTTVYRWTGSGWEVAQP